MARVRCDCGMISCYICGDPKFGTKTVDMSDQTNETVDVAVRMNFCTECSHLAFRHEIGMNTQQRGICLADGCDCHGLDTPSRDELGDEVERLLHRLTEAEQQVAEIQACLTAEELSYKELLDDSVMVAKRNVALKQQVARLTRENGELRRERYAIAVHHNQKCTCQTIL